MPKQEIIFRFTIPADPSSIPRLPIRSNLTDNVTAPNNNTTGSIVPSDYFTVCAFGTEYLVEYPSGIAGFRRPCTNRLGYISLPTYYDVPQVQHLGGRRYRVQVPKEILSSGEKEFYVSLPDIVHTTTSTCTDPASLPPPPPFQVRLIVPDSRPTFLEFDAPEDTLSCGAILCRWKKAQSPETIFQVMIPPLAFPSPKTPPPTATSSSLSLPHSHSSSHTIWDQTQYILTSLGSLPAVLTRPPDAPNDDSLITFSVPLRAVPIYSKTIRNHAIQCHQEHLQDAETEQREGGGEWHRLYHVTTNRLQWFYFHPSPSCQSCAKNDHDATLPKLQLAHHTPAAWVCHLMNLDTTTFVTEQHASSSLSTTSIIPRKPAKRTPWSLVPIHEAQGLPITILSHDRKTLDGYPQTIGSFWDLVVLTERQRQRTLTQWRLKLQGDAIGNGHAGSTCALTMIDLPPDSLSDLGHVLQAIGEAVETQLVSPSRLRGLWGIQEPLLWMLMDSTTSSPSSSSSSLSCCWMYHLAQSIVQYELQPTPGNLQRWEFRSTSRLGLCRLLGILVGKSLVQENSPVFSPQIQLATYLYKYLLQWPIQYCDYLQVVGRDSPGSTTNKDSDHPQQLLLFDRLFESTKDPISSFLDGVFMIVPLSFMLVFRTIEELEDCLVDSKSHHL